MIKFLKNIFNNSYTTGKLNNIVDDLKNKYHKNPILLREHLLTLPDFTMKELANDKNHCSLTAITRVLLYSSIGYNKLPDDRDYIYNEIKKIAKNRLAYNRIIGTIPFMISFIIKSFLKSYPYNFKIRGKYIWDFNTIESEINNNRPLIFNIAGGYYRKHTVTVVGYRVFIIDGNINYILIIHDGWNKDLRYINFTEFHTNKYLTGIGSFNTVES